MQTAAMLLRSSSSPLLVDCLVTHTEPSLDGRSETIAPAESLHRSSRGCNYLSSPSLHPRLLMDCPIAPAKLSEPRAASSEFPSCGFSSSSLMRKVLSETDLSSLGVGGGSVTPSQVAANTLVHESVGEDSMASDSPSSASSLSSSSKKGRTLLPLCRQMSLGSLPSELPSVCFNGDWVGNDLPILEEGESLSSYSSDASGIESGTCAFDIIALPVGKFVQTKHHCPVMEEEDQELERSARSDEDGMVASSSGRGAGDEVFRQGSLQHEMARGSMVCTLERPYESMATTSYLYGGDGLETGFNGGNGDSGGRMRTMTGGGSSGGGDGGGHGGKSADATEQHYQQVLQRDPGNPLLLRNYAQYLSDVKHEHSRAEEYYQRAILASPGDGELLGQYAKMLWEVWHDAERAGSYFERAVQIAPDNSYVMAAYASFLWSLEEDEQETAIQSVRGPSTSDFPASFPSLVSAGLA